MAAVLPTCVGPTDPDCFAPPILGEVFHWLLGLILDDIDYESDPKSGCAITARMLASLITNTEDVSLRHLN